MYDFLDYIVSATKDIPIFWQIILTIIGMVIIVFLISMITNVEQNGKNKHTSITIVEQIRYGCLLGIIITPCCFCKLFPLGVICFVFIVSILAIQAIWCLFINKMANRILYNKKTQNNNNLIDTVTNSLINKEINIERAIGIIANNDSDIEKYMQNNTFSELINDSNRLEHILKHKGIL